MKPFRFPLETVLTLRRMENERALEAYAYAVQASAEAKRCYLSALRRQIELADLTREGRGGTFSPAMQEAYGVAVAAAGEEAEKIHVTLQEASRAEAEALAGFVEAKKQLEVMERLKERKRESHRKETLRREELELEEIAIARYAV